MKYIVKVDSIQGDPVAVEWSGILHDSKDEARKELERIQSEEMERSGIDAAWIEEVEE